MNTSKLFNLNWGDIGKGIVMAVIGGAVLPILAVLQTPDFSFATANWGVILTLAENGAAAAFASYLMKNLFSDKEGKFLGKVG